ncbi:hypothetical protein ACK4CH_04000 [Enterococcus gallinarum]|uniref:hypothetical protein n=1 Tax=Enterococcus gallinarum TaxID=1353 RepID=UPI00391B02E0
MNMLSKAIAFLEKLPAVVLHARLMKREEGRVYTIEAKTAQGKVELFQLRGRTLYHHVVHLGKPIEEKVLFQFSEQIKKPP